MDIQLRKLSGYGVPLLGVALSLPVLLGILATDILLCYEAITGYTHILRSIVDSIQPTAFSTLVLYAVFGPILACVLCVGQLTHSGQTHALDKTARRANVTVLFLAPLALGLVLLTGFVLWGLRGGT